MYVSHKCTKHEINEGKKKTFPYFSHNDDGEDDWKFYEWKIFSRWKGVCVMDAWSAVLKRKFGVLSWREFES